MIKNKIKNVFFTINTSRMNKVISGSILRSPDVIGTEDGQSSVNRTSNLPQGKKGQGYNYKILCPKTVSNGGTQ